MVRSINIQKSMENDRAKKREYYAIKELIENGKIELAKLALEKYLEDYPRNSYGLKEYASILRQEGDILQALSLLSESEEVSLHIIKERIFCYIGMEEYELALKEVYKILETSQARNYLESFCKVKLGICDASDLRFYTARQAFHYSEEEALQHIKKHTRKRAKGNSGYCYFSPDISIEEIYHNIRNLLPDAQSIITDDFMKCYIFQINGIGYTDEDLPVNHLQVTVLPNSSDIITMFPYIGNKKNNINNYNDMLAVREDYQPIKKLKRESQIEKFNRRYGNNK